MENLKSIKVKIFYDDDLRKITGKDLEEAVVSENLDFVAFLNFIFSSYPEIPKKFLPGTLAFSLNGRKPKEDEILNDGDELKMSGMTIEEIRNNIEFQINEIIDSYKIDATFEKIREKVFNENNQKDFNDLSRLFVEKIANLDEINAVLQVVNAAWNYFPHRSLNGFCPMEKIIESPKTKKLKIN